MSSPKALIRSRPIFAYFVLAFLISWGGMLILALPSGMPAPQAEFEARWPIVFLPYLFGPLLASLILTGIIDGRTGYKVLFSRFLSWRIQPTWVALALLTVPLVVLAILLPLSLLSTDFLPAIFTAENKSELLIMGLSIGLLGGGLLEELGWTGFATPRMLQKRSVFSAGLILGMVWGIWHILPTLWGSGDTNGVFDPMLFLPPLLFYIGVLPAYRILMVWLFDQTDSLILILLMHMSLTASTLFILAPAVVGIPLISYYLILTLLFWAIVMLAFRHQPQSASKFATD